MQMSACAPIDVPRNSPHPARTSTASAWCTTFRSAIVLMPAAPKARSFAPPALATSTPATAPPSKSWMKWKPSRGVNSRMLRSVHRHPELLRRNPHDDDDDQFSSFVIHHSSLVAYHRGFPV